MECAIEIEGADGRQRDCRQEAAWVVTSAVHGGPLGGETARCWDHVGGTVEFFLSLSSTTAVHLERVR